MLDSDESTAARRAETSGDDLAFAPIHLLADRLKDRRGERERAARLLSAAHTEV